MSIKIKIWRLFHSSNSKNIYTISWWSRPCLFHIEIFDFSREFHIHDFRILLSMSSLRARTDIPSIRHRVHYARAGLRPYASIPKTDKSIQSRAILKILDMIFARNSRCRLQTIHYYVISKIVDITGLISKTQLALRYPAFKKRRIPGYSLREILLYGPKSISTILEIRIFSIVRFYAYVWFSRKPSNKRLIRKLWIVQRFLAKTKKVLKVSTYSKSACYSIVPSFSLDWTVTRSVTVQSPCLS